jgi:outer membrane lipopolysaccharide assembly protein LptE/RlpB
VIRVRNAAALFALLLAPAALAGCGYSLAGRGTFLPDYIRLVGIPACINQGSTIFNIDNVLTEQLQKEFASHGHYRVLPSTTGVDAVLTCRIVSTTITPTAVNNNNQASRYAFVITAGIEFKDTKDDKILWQNPSLQVREEYDVTTASAANDPSAFFGQDQNSMGRMARTFGRTVVTSVLEAF